MNSTMIVTNQEAAPEVLPSLTHAEAVASLTGIAAAMAALDRHLELCTDPLEESCLLTLRVEREVEYLETLYRWDYESSEVPLLQ